MVFNQLSELIFSRMWTNIKRAARRDSVKQLHTSGCRAGLTVASAGSVWLWQAVSGHHNTTDETAEVVAVISLHPCSCCELDMLLWSSPDHVILINRIKMWNGVQSKYLPFCRISFMNKSKIAVKLLISPSLIGWAFTHWGLQWWMKQVCCRLVHTSWTWLSSFSFWNHQRR